MVRRPAAARASRAPQSVDRIFAVLDHLAGEPAGESLAGIARAARAPKTSMVGLLAGMLQAGYLARDPDGRYALGPRMMALSLRVAARSDISMLARPVLARLVEQTGETALLGRLEPDEDVATYVDSVDSPNPMRYTVAPGERRELHCTAIGKLLLAYMEPARRERYLARPLRSFTARTVTSSRQLRIELRRIAREGISRTDSERIQGASALAAPVFGARGEFLFGIVIAGPSERMRSQSRHEARVRAAAEELTQLISGEIADSTP